MGVLAQAVRLAPTDVRYLLNAADTLVSLLRHAEALAYFERAAALAPTVGPIHAAVGTCHRSYCAVLQRRVLLPQEAQPVAT
jgi:tetratricopeptide (TPR) repeat protein